MITKSTLHTNKEVYVMSADGSGQTRLTTDLANDDSPSWSPDGSKIVFRSDRERDCCDPTAQVWVMNADGSGLTNLSNSGDSDYSASWTYGGVIDTPFGGGTRENQSPVANPGGPYNSQTGQVVQLNGSASFDPNGTITSYSWDFGDGTSGAGVVVNHQYNAAGIYSVSLAVTDNNGNTASSQGFVTVDSVSLPVKIDFDRFPDGTPVPNNTVIYEQYLAADGVRFYSDNAFTPVRTSQNCGSCFTSSLPNFVWTAPNITGQTIVEFTQPASNLSFYIVGIDVFFDPFAVIDVYRNNAFYGPLTVFGNGTATKQISFGSLDNINKIVIRSITDPFGIGFDDFSFNVPADVKVTNPELNNYPNPKGGTLTPNTQYNELVWADVVLNAVPTPGAFAGGTYHWTFTGPSSISAGNQNGPSVTLRSTDVGTITATLTYSKSGIVVSRSFPINSTLPRLTNFTTHQNSDRVSAPYACGNTFQEIFWRYRLGCPLTLPQVGISFDAHIETDPFISDGSQSGIKFVQAVSTFRKKVARGVRCITRRATESDVRSGWQLDTEDPYGKEENLWWDFSGILVTSFHAETNDSPSDALTEYTDWDFTDSVYIDDQFEMYIVYYTGKADAPQRQQPLGKVRWNWGGLVVFDWNGTDAVHTIHSSNSGAPIFEYTNSIVSMNGNVEQTKLTDVQCPGGPGLTNNRIDSAREFVKFHYIDFLRRDPTPRPNDNPPYPGDPRGWNFWTSNISQCIFDLNCIHVQRVETGLGFFYSAEFMQRATQVDPVLADGPGSPGFNAPLYNRAFVKWCYLTYLQRDPNITQEDREGWDFWTNDLNSNGDYFHTIDSFQLCGDYRNGRTFQ